MAVPRFLLVLLAMALLVAGAAGQSTSNCSSAYTSLAPCVTYVAGSDATPSTLCCVAVTVLNADNPACLCQGVALLNNGSTPNVNTTKAYALPGACGVTLTTANCPALATPPGVSTPPLVGFPPPPGTASPPPPGAASPPPPPSAGNAAAVSRPSPLLAALAALGVSVFFSELWVRAF